MFRDKKLNPVLTELFIRGRKLNISMILLHNLILQFQKNVRLNSTLFYIMQIPRKRECWQIAINHSSDFDFKDFIKIYKKYTEEPYSFLVNNTTFLSDNPVSFRKNLLKWIYN